MGSETNKTIEIKNGKFGAYFFDSKNIRDLDLKTVCHYLNQREEWLIENTSLRTENAELRAVVEKLPKDADGVPVPPSTEFLWEINNYNGEPRKIRPTNPGYLNTDISQSFVNYYSTRESALAARTAEQEGGG